MSGVGPKLGLAAIAALALCACGDEASPSPDGAPPPGPCGSAIECDDGRFCNGIEECQPADARADDRGCVPGTPVACLPGQRCDAAEDRCLTDCGVTLDADGDGQNALECGGTDCDDSERGRFVGNPEVCDDLHVDEDCDTSTFGGRDEDGDGFVDARCCNLAGDTQRCGEDCNDTARTIHPNSSEACDGEDDDCDGSIDEDGPTDWFPDCDGDGHGDPSGTTMLRCGVPPVRADCPGATAFWTPVGDDCDDADSEVRPSAFDICNARDDDCDSVADEATATTKYCNEPARQLLHAVMTCVAGSCALAECIAPWLDCVVPDAGCETDPASTAAHCSACGNACAWDICTSSSCEPLEIDAGGQHTCARMQARVVCWGRGGDGQLGDGVFLASSTTPIDVIDAPASVDEIALGFGHSCARTSGGRVYCWGDNRNQQLGVAAPTRSATPVLAPEVSGAAEITAGLSHTCARTGGSVRCWGGGWLGDGGSWSGTATPVVAVGIVTAVEIDAGDEYTCARLSSGSVQCWGRGRLGGSGDVRTPVAVTGLADAAEIAAGGRHTCARRASGAVVCWGSNAAGQLGDGTTTDRLTPVPVIGVGDALEIAAGSVLTCARRRDGSVWCWGDDGGTALGSSPVRMDGLDGALELTAGDAHACARLPTGPMCWGSGNEGRLGNGGTGDSPTPVAVTPPP